MRKSILSALIVLIVIPVTALVPQSNRDSSMALFNYQAIIRDGSGIPMPNQTVSFKFAIVAGPVPEDTLYVEKHLTTTNPYGMVNFVVGNGVKVDGEAKDVTHTHWVDILSIVWYDPEGGDNFEFMTKQQVIPSVGSRKATSVHLTDDDGNVYELKVDTQGNLSAVRIYEWECGDEITDQRDGQQYPTVQIGDQCWMAKNMNIGYIIPGAEGQTNNDSIERYCYNDSIENCEHYGGLYQWNEMMQYTGQTGEQGICPAGWHVPSDSEWCTLENFVDAGLVICTTTGHRGTNCGLNLKSVNGWTDNGNGTDQYGFTALPAGYRLFNGSYSFSGVKAYFWSSSEVGQGVGWLRQLANDSDKVNRSSLIHAGGLSVRCIKD